MAEVVQRLALIDAYQVVDLTAYRQIYHGNNLLF